MANRDAALTDAKSDPRLVLILFTTLTKNTARILKLVPQALSLGYRRPGRALLIMRMANWLIILSVLMKFRSLPRALEKISPATRQKLQTRPGEDQELASAVDALLGTEFFVFRPICWKRAAILHRYLALRGIESQIKFGLRKEPDGKVAGHAWLEQAGKPILESSTPDYVVTYSYPSAESRPGKFAFPLET